MKKWAKYLMISMLAGTVLVACSKDDDDTVAPSGSKTSQLAHTWIMSNAELIPPLIDIWGAIPPCDKDDELAFHVDGTGIEDNGLLKCDTNDPQTETFTWVWENNQKDLKITETDTVIRFRNVALTSTTMTGEISYPIDSVNFIDAKVTFTKK